MALGVFDPKGQQKTESIQNIHYYIRKLDLKDLKIIEKVAQMMANGK